MYTMDIIILFKYETEKMPVYHLVVNDKHLSSSVNSFVDLIDHYVLSL